MSFFSPIDGHVVLRSRGRFYEVTLAACDGEIYAKNGKAYVKLKRDGDTSIDRLYWGLIDSTAARSFDRTTGSMVLLPATPRTQIMAA